MRRGKLIALDGVDGRSLRAAAKAAVAESRRAGEAGASYWDASGVFGELAIGDKDAGITSPRTLLLLYAADLAFRVRWEIGPALQDGRTVVAAPYIQTAVAFGRAVGIPSVWLSNLFQFAPPPAERRVVEPTRVPKRGRTGFLDLAWERWAEAAGISRARLSRETAAYLHPRRARR
jgi:thymidylate kinase